MNTKNLLLLTATITPKSGVPNLKRIDAEKRLADYYHALDFYLTQIDSCCDGILFVENSNSDISTLQQLVEQHGKRDQVEFIVFDGLDYPAHYDRGYGEFKLLDYGMSHSTLLQQCQGTAKTIIWKMTGRYIIRNLDHIISTQPQDFDLYCNFRNYPKRWVDTYFMAWTPQGYETCIRDVYHRLKTNVTGIPDGIAAEELLRSWLDQRFIRHHANIKRRFQTTPALEGIRGADNSSYSTDNLWKYRSRNLMKKVLPWIWI